MKETKAVRIIKKYPNRRLYDTEKSSYITLNEVLEIIRSGQEFKVVDAVSGDDISRSILVQIIIEQENGESPIFTTDMLTRFIRFYDDAAQNLFGEFLERNMQIFSDQQKRFQQQMVEGMINSPATRMMQDAAERNLSLWQDMQQRFFDLATAGIRNPDAGGEGGDDDEKSSSDAAKKKKTK
ncbi:MAG: polyhydroxyalkanoate synthesis repressor PhaR [Alphaproteobacteria bacterium]|nr:polyhydroxyalkanoate synthesis repressor PhaR [Alphaproteobacteria bacterium]